MITLWVIAMLVVVLIGSQSLIGMLRELHRINASPPCEGDKVLISPY